MDFTGIRSVLTARCPTECLVKWHRSALIGLTFLLGAASITNAQVREAQIPILTERDYQEIDQLYAGYMHGISTGESDGRVFSTLFTEDGIHVCGECLSGSFVYYYGPGALAGLATGALVLSSRAAAPDGDGASIALLPANGGKGPNNVDHVVANTVLEPVPGGVVTKSYLLRLSDVPSSNGLSLASAGGVFFDFVVKTDKGWKFKRKSFVSIGRDLPSTLPPTLRGSNLEAMLNKKPGG